MNDRELEQKLNAAVSAVTPDVLDSIHSDLHDQKGNVLIMKTNTAASSLRRVGAGVAAAFVLGATALFSYAQYNLHHAVASTVALDVNPSIEIRLSKKEDVLDVIAKNEDGQIVIGDMDFRGSDLTVTVNALIGSMLREGYLNELSNSILISVESDDTERSAALQAKLSEEVRTLLQTDSFTGSVLSQTTTADQELLTAAEQWDITVGKAALIREITKNTHHTMEELADLSVNELNLLLSTAAVPSETVSSSGTASDKSYIGRDAALETACTHAGTTASAVRDPECELDWDNGKMIYEIEFYADGYEYEYDIHATTGQILISDQHHTTDLDELWHDVLDDLDDHDDHDDHDHHDEYYDDDDVVVSPSSQLQIDGNTALSSALAHAGVSNSDIRDLDVELDEDDGHVLYEIEFEADGYDFSYKIDAFTGNVIYNEKERD